MTAPAVQPGAAARSFDRGEMIRRLGDRRDPWDLVVIGGGATGLGVALDAQARGLDVALIERRDFASGTSSRSTKLIHGGVRYLQQGNLTLVREALRERALLRRNAPHLVDDARFVIPATEWWHRTWYGTGLRIYDRLGGGRDLGRTRALTRDEVVDRIPGIDSDGLRGGIEYGDGRFDDAALAIAIARTAAATGAVLVNHAPATGIRHDASGRAVAVDVIDGESRTEMTLPARAIVNAAGPFADSVRRLDDAGAEPMIAASRGVHLVMSGDALGGEHALMVPRTSDGRVFFAIPWHGRTIIGTTDTPVDGPVDEPAPSDDEVAFLLETAAGVLSSAPASDDVLATFSGIRPLVRPERPSSGRTSRIARDHAIRRDPRSGMITVAGGKWTTYRRMAEDTVDRVVSWAGLDAGPCRTEATELVGRDDPALLASIAAESPEHGSPFDPRLEVTPARIAFACRHEMARTLDDALSRRDRAVILDARATADLASDAADTMAAELGWTTGRTARELAAFLDRTAAATLD